MDKLDEHISVEEKRLDRIEAKIDKLAETVVALARAEEKLISLEDDRKIVNDRLNRHSDRIDDIESKIDETGMTVRVINRIFWIFVSVTAAAFVGTLFMQQ